jgi:hypothetical protein
VNRKKIALIVALLMLVGVPAYAYADPTGGTLFQVLMPMLAAIWATWMILANRVRRGVAGLMRKLRGPERDEPTD